MAVAGFADPGDAEIPISQVQMQMQAQDTECRTCEKIAKLIKQDEGELTKDCKSIHFWHHQCTK